MKLEKLIRNRLKDLRVKHGVTQEKLAEVAGVNYKYYQSVEAGRRRELRVSTIEKFAKAYSVTPSQLISPTFPSKTKLARKK